MTFAESLNLDLDDDRRPLKGRHIPVKLTVQDLAAIEQALATLERDSVLQALTYSINKVTERTWGRQRREEVIEEFNSAVTELESCKQYLDTVRAKLQDAVDIALEEERLQLKLNL